MHLSVAAQPAPTVAKLTLDIQTLYTDLIRDDAKVAALVASIYGDGLVADKRRAAMASVRRLFGNRQLWTYIAGEIQFKIQKSSTAADVRAWTREATLTLQTKGMRRVTPSRQAEYVDSIISFAKSLQPSPCKAIFLGTDGASTAQLERSYKVGLSLQRFESYLDLVNEAIESELAKSPPVRTITPEQEKVAEAANGIALKARMKLLPPGIEAEVRSNPGKSAPALACQFFVASMAAQFDLKEPVRSWQLTKYIAALQ